MPDSNHIYTSPVGNILVKCSENFVTGLLFISENDLNKTRQALENSAEENAGPIRTCIQQLNEYFDGTRRIFDLPLRQEGTVFQQKIWTALTAIPYGKTISYMELARRTGDVKAIRAVGTTNGKNQLSIVVPCHRVIGSDGTLTGYSGGLWRKKWLLDHEAKIANGLQTLF